MTARVIVRIEPGLKEKVGRLARAEGKNVSEVVRGLIEDTVQQRDMGAYVDGLWDRIGGKLASKGARPGTAVA